MKLKDETDEVLELLPDEPAEARSVAGSFYFDIPVANAFVCKDPYGNINIYPIKGGLLVADKKYIEGDIAPFAG